MGNSSNTTMTAKAIADYRADLATRIQTATADAASATTSQGSANSNRQYKICAFNKTQDTLTFYANLDFCTAIEAQQNGIKIGDKITAIGKQYDDFQKKFNDALKAIKGLRTQLLDVENKAYDVGNQFEDPCNVEQVRKLKDVTNKTMVMEQLIKPADDASDQANLTFATAVDIAGIQTFSSIDSLKNFGMGLKDKTDGFKKNVDENSKKATDDLKKAQTELGKATETLIVGMLTSKDSAVLLASEQATDGTLGNDGFCGGLPDDKIKTICQDIENRFSQTETTESPNRPSKAPPPPRQKGYRD